MKNKSKIITIIIITILLLIAVPLGVYAYFTYRTTVTNTVKLGYNQIQLLENYTPPLSMAKGISFEKEPYVQNIGNVDCYVRVKSVVSDSRVEQYLTIDYNTTDYTYNAQDGYWYYNNLVRPGESTTPLFTTVSISPDADDIVLDGFDIYVYGESIQTIEGKTMEEAWN